MSAPEVKNWNQLFHSVPQGQQLPKIRITILYYKQAIILFFKIELIIAILLIHIYMKFTRLLPFIIS